MHPKNPYKTPPDFKEMAVKYPEFRKVVTQDISGKIHLDFNDPVALRMLTTTLFRKDFQLEVGLPENSLVPTLPSRLNYLLWVEDLLALLPETSEAVLGLDVGTGASAVYPLLAAKHLGWTMVATESDKNNYDSAVDNITRNNLVDKIDIKLVCTKEIFITVLANDKVYDFSMCNPPFFKADKVFDGELAGTATEIQTDGGEVEFINRMIKESKQIKDKVKIFTVLLGHKASVCLVKKLLVGTQVSSLVTTQFCQGKTMRWGMAWTFQQGLALDTVVGTKAKKEKPKPFSFAIDKAEHLPVAEQNAMKSFHKMRTWLEEIKVEVVTRKESKYLCSARLTARERSWQNQRKKRREKKRNPSLCLNGESKDTTNGDFGKFSEVESTSSGTNTEQLEDALLSEMLSSEAGCQAVKNDALATSCGTDPGLAAPVVECDLFVRWAGPVVKVDLCLVGGDGGREAVHQLTQFLKNKYSSNR